MADTNESIGSGVGNPGEGLLQLARREMTSPYVVATEVSGKIAVAVETEPAEFPRPFAFDPLNN
jgi:hypothetical protein